MLEHFLTILPKNLQSWVQQQYSESGEQVTVLEDLEKELNDPGERRERECELSSGKGFRSLSWGDALTQQLKSGQISVFSNQV